MRSRSLLMLATAFVGTVMLSGTAMATPVIVDGISLPAYSDGDLSIGLSDHETKVTGIGQTLSGTGVLTSITGGSNQTYGNSHVVTSTGAVATDGIITDVFEGFKVRAISYSAGQTTIDFTGGSLDLYVQPKIPNTTTVGLAASLANASVCTPACSTGAFLKLAPEVQDAFGDTFIVTITGNSLTTFNISNGTAFLDVIGGDAASYFNTNTIANGFGTQLADLAFAGNAASGNDGKAFGVGGNDTFYNREAGSVPEPLTLSLFGAGLIGAAAMRRRQKPKKS